LAEVVNRRYFCIWEEETVRLTPTQKRERHVEIP
jgi:hypothetical protein